MTSHTPTPGPQTPAPSLVDAARKLAAAVHDGGSASAEISRIRARVLANVDPRAIRRELDGNLSELFDHLYALGASVRRALVAEEEREKIRQDARRELRAEMASAAAALETVADPAQLPAATPDGLANLRSYAALHARAARRALDEEKGTR